MDFRDFEEADLQLIEKVQAFTMTSPERIYALVRAVEHIIRNDIPGDFVECGVWRGGSMMVVAITLLKLKNTSRHLYLFDTFEGMTEPTAVDVSLEGEKASEILQRQADKKDHKDSVWAYAHLSQVKEAMFTTGYEPNRIHFVKGKIEDTVPESAPEKISLLRLDTDWYESTRHELIHLYPRLSVGGVIIIDDYGHWLGAKKATEEYIQENNICLLLNRVDYTGRVGVKGCVAKRGL